MKNIKIAITALFCYFTFSCTYVITSSYDHRSPALDANFKEELDHSKIKTGRASCLDVEEEEGSLSVYEAAKKAGIKRILFIDKESKKSYFLFFHTGSEECTVVHGY